MLRRILPLLASIAACPLVTFAQEAVDAGPPRVLFLTHSAGFMHGVVKRPSPDELSHAERALVDAAAGRMEVVPTQDCGAITAENLARFDAVLFYTTGELPIPDEERAALIDWIRSGGAFVGSHCATDTLYQYAPYMDLVGGAFDGHPWHQEVTVLVEAPEHPSTAHLGESFRITDEIYQFRDWHRHPLRVLLSLDPDSVEIEKGKRADRDNAVSWCKSYGQGRMFYTSLGHRPAVWDDARFQEHLMRGIEWAIGGPDHSPPAPAGADVLFDGASLDAWRKADGSPAAWKLVDGAMEVAPGTGNVFSEDLLGSGLLHVEFRVPETPADNRWQDRGNSGVYVQGRYELQVLDSLGLELKSGDCGGIYGKHIPAVDACRPAGEWQSFDIRFTAPTFDASGTKTGNARITAWHNGLLIHDDVEVDGPTAAAMAGDEPGVGPLMLQDHGHPVRYRNLWFLAEAEPAQVLILGDSISIGYTAQVQQRLEGVARVVRPMRDEQRAENCAQTEYGLERIDAWLGDTEWDVIHFNWGLHDLKYVPPSFPKPALVEERGEAILASPDARQLASLEEYETNLEALVVRMKQTGARLVFATTTPIPEGARGRLPGDEERYNAVALEVMKRHDVAVDDLFTFVHELSPPEPVLSAIQNDADVHFKAAGNERLGQQVAASVRAQLALER